MKTIGIILREWFANVDDIELYGFRRDLLNFLRKFDVNVIAIPILNNNENEFEKLRGVIDMCDGIIFTGGVRYSKVEIEIHKYLHRINKPDLGFCLGFQTMGKAFNGEIVPVGNENHKSEEKYVHDVIIDKNSKLFEIIGEEKIKVNSRHRYCMINSSLTPVAYSDEDNILEAFEDKNKKFFIGVQWHPESLIDDVYSNKLFDYFIKCL